MGKVSLMTEKTTPLVDGDMLYVVDSADGNSKKFDAKNLSSTGYKVYSAILTQAGTNPPVATIMKNTLSGVPTWSYVGVGDYKLTLPGEWTADKTMIMLSSVFGIAGAFRNDVNEIEVFTEVQTVAIGVYTFPAGNGVLQQTAIEIRVYE